MPFTIGIVTKRFAFLESSHLSIIFAIKVKDDIDAISSVIARGDVMHPLFSYEEAYAP